MIDITPTNPNYNYNAANTGSNNTGSSDNVRTSPAAHKPFSARDFNDHEGMNDD